MNLLSLTALFTRLDLTHYLHLGTSISCFSFDYQGEFAIFSLVAHP